MNKAVEIFQKLFPTVRSWADVRAWLYTVLPVLTAFLVSKGALTEDRAALWLGLVTAVLGPGISFLMTRNLSNFRTAFYAIAGAGQLLLISYGLVAGHEFDAWMPLISAILGGAAGGAATVNTPTTSAFTQGQQEAEAKKAPVLE